MKWALSADKSVFIQPTPETWITTSDDVQIPNKCDKTQYQINAMKKTLSANQSVFIQPTYETWITTKQATKLVQKMYPHTPKYTSHPKNTKITHKREIPCQYH